MDPLSQKHLEEIIATGPDSITEADAAFLRARRSYLNSDQREAFAEALGEDDPTPAAGYAGLSLKKLKALAKERDLEVMPDDTAEQLIEALTAADAAQ